MKLENLKAAIAEAKRFLDRAAKVETRTYDDIYGKKHHEIEAGAASGACRRASLDLTRALAELRR